MSAATAMMATSAMAVIGGIWPRRPGACWCAPARSSVDGPSCRALRLQGLCRRARLNPSAAPRERCDAEVAGRCNDVGRAAMRLDAALAIGALLAGAFGRESRQARPRQPAPIRKRLEAAEADVRAGRGAPRGARHPLPAARWAAGRGARIPRAPRTLRDPRGPLAAQPRP